MGDYLERASRESSLIFDKKIEKMSELTNINEIIKQKVSLVLEERKEQPQKYIIGKTKVTEKIGAIKEEDFEIRFEKLTTYVLENKPTNTGNKSMNSKDFYSYNLSGIAHVFVSNQSKFNIDSEAKDV